MLPKCNQNVVLYWLCVGIFSLSSSFSYPFRFRKTALCSLHIKTQKWKWIFGVSVRVNVPLEWQIFIWYNENQAIQANQISVEKRNYWKRNTIFICDHHTIARCPIGLRKVGDQLKDIQRNWNTSSTQRYHLQTIGFGYGCQRDYDTHSQCELSILDQILL